MLTISCLIYGMLLCFIWSEKASDYVDAYWDILEEVLDGSMADPEALKEMMYKNASAAGGMCLAMIFLDMICVHCCAVLMGYKYTARKTVMWINGFGFLIGLSVMIIAFMPSTQEVVCLRVCTCARACTHVCACMRVCMSLPPFLYSQYGQPPPPSRPRSRLHFGCLTMLLPPRPARLARAVGWVQAAGLRGRGTGGEKDIGTASVVQSLMSRSWPRQEEDTKKKKRKEDEKEASLTCASRSGGGEEQLAAGLHWLHRDPARHVGHHRLLRREQTQRQRAIL